MIHFLFVLRIQHFLSSIEVFVQLFLNGVLNLFIELSLNFVVNFSKLVGLREEQLL